MNFAETGRGIVNLYNVYNGIITNRCILIRRSFTFITHAIS